MRWLKRCIPISAWLFSLAALASTILPLISRDAEYHRFGEQAFLQDNTSTWGGVIMQATGTFVNTQKRPVSPVGISLRIERKQGQDGVCVVHRSRCHWMALSPSETVALARWITSRATGAFSAFSLEADVLRKAGLTKEGGFAVPIEFSGTSLVAVLEGADFEFLLEDVPNEKELLARYQKLAAESTVGWRGSYFVSDLDSQFEFRLNEGALELTGTPFKYDWNRTNGQYARAEAIKRFVPDSKVAEAGRRFVAKQLEELGKERSELETERADIGRKIADLSGEEKEQLEFELGDINDQLAELEEEKNEIPAKAEIRKQSTLRSNELFRKTALLRTVYDRNKPAWESFLQQISKVYEAEISRRMNLEKSYGPK